LTTEASEDLAQEDGEVLDPMSKDVEGDDFAVARFLRTCPGLSKAIIGDLLGQNNERCLRVLDAFTHMFDFSGAASLLSPT
jgi:Sec7-like guanine-nucleotide exchange factor